jgi:hypothetical protein
MIRRYNQNCTAEKTSAMGRYALAPRKTETFRANTHCEPFFAGIVAKSYEKTEQNSGGAPNFPLCFALFNENWTPYGQYEVN